MAIVIGTSAGFVTAAPSGDPNGGSSTAQDTTSRAIKDTCPAVLTKISEVGWYCNNATPEANYEVGLYSHDAGNDVPLNRLFVDNTNAKGTGAGWKTATVNWTITPETVYWIAIQLDNTTPNSAIDFETTGSRTSIMTSQSSLAHPWNSAGITAYIMAIYAKVEAGVTYSELAGTIAAASSVSGNLGSTSVGLDPTTTVFTKRLIVAGNNRIYSEDI